MASRPSSFTRNAARKRVRELVNLAVDLDERFDAAPPLLPPGIVVESGDAPDGATLAWIDEVFGGTWSSEAFAGSNLVARRDGRPLGFATYDPRGLRFAWLRGAGREPGTGIFGPFGVVEAERGGLLGRALLFRTLAAMRARGFTRALVPAVGASALVRYYESASGARIVERFDASAWPRVRTLVMASGSGTNVQAVLDRAREGTLPLDVVALVANVPDARVITRAREAGVPTIHVLPWNKREQTRAQYDEELLRTVRAEAPDLVLLLGWMHLLAEPFVRAFPNLLNVHPAFLPLDPACDDVATPDGTVIPAFRGAHAVRDAIAGGSSWYGATLHSVTPQTDRGPVLARRPLRLHPGEDQASALERLHPVEHELVADGIRRWVYER